MSHAVAWRWGTRRQSGVPRLSMTIAMDAWMDALPTAVHLL